MAVIPEHRDLFGQVLEVDDCVVFPNSNIMCVGRVIKLNPKMIGVRSISRRRGHVNKYPSDLVKVTGSEVTMYLLKKSNDN